MMNSVPHNDMRFERISDSSLRNLISSARSNVNERNVLPTLTKIKKNPELVSTGGIYFVTSNWELFSKHYFKHFIPTGDVIAQYLGMRVEVLEMQKPLVRVSFQDSDLDDGWLPWKVLKSSKAGCTKLKLIQGKDSKSLDRTELEQEELKNKIKTLHMRVSTLEEDNLQSQRIYKQVKAKNSELKKNIEDITEKFSEEKKQLQQELTESRATMYQSLQRAKELEKTHIPRDIEHLPSLLENATLPDLLQASQIISQKMAEETRRLELERIRSEDRQLCRVCLHKPKTHMFEPCKHFCVCSHCAVRCKEARGHSCPICRSPIASIERVYAV